MGRPINIDKAVVKIAHSELTRSSDRSIYRSECPVCKEGVLLVKRAADGSLMAEDMCIYCGQRFEYLDIAEMRKKEGK